MSRKAIIAIVLIAVLAAIGIGYYVLSNQSADAVTAGGGRDVGFTLVPTDRTMGNPKAPVT